MISSKIDSAQKQTYLFFRSPDYTGSVKIDCEERKEICSERFYSWCHELLGNRVILREPKAKKFLIVQAEDLKALPVAASALKQLVSFTAGASNRRHMLQNLLFPQQPALIPYLNDYGGGIITHEESQTIFEQQSEIAVRYIHSILTEPTSTFCKQPLAHPKDGLNTQLSEKYQKIMSYASRKRHETAFLQDPTLTEENNKFGIKRINEQSAKFFGLIENASLNCLFTRLGGHYECYGLLLIDLVKQRGYQRAIEGGGEQVLIGRDVKSYGPAHLSVSAGLGNILDEKKHIFECLRKKHDLASKEGWVISLYLNSIEENHSELVAEYVFPKIAGGSFSMENLQFDIPIICNYAPSEKVEEWIDKQMNDCCNWKEGDGEDKLKEKVAILRYLLALTSCYKRGSAAIAEDIEKALYKYHGFAFEYKYPGSSTKQPSADLDAYLCLSLEEYIQTYKTKACLSFFHLNPESNIRTDAFPKIDP